jgi:hypothetical protein
MGHVSPISARFDSIEETIMTAALYDEAVTVAPAHKLAVVRDATRMRAPALTKETRRVDSRTIVITDPLVDGAARLLTIGVRHMYAALWRVGVLEVQA